MTKSIAEHPETPIRRTARRRMLLVGVPAVLALVVGCKPKHKTAPPVAAAAVDSTPAEADPAPPPVPVAAAPVVTVRPACDQFTVTENGVGALEIGDPRDSIRERCSIVSDSTALNAEGSVQGNVVVAVSGTPLVAEVADGRVYRLGVADSVFRTRDGLGPGMPAMRLLDLPGAIVLEGVHDLSIVVDAHCGLYFRISKPAVPPENGQRWSDVVRAMPPGTPVERVVVHGCRTPAT